MPLDDTGFRPDPAAYRPAASPAYKDRWSCAPPNQVPVPRANFTPRSDAQALLHIWQMLETKCSRRFNDGAGGHCIVGWVYNTCDPLSVISWNTPQAKRLLQRLHDALPKWAQRKNPELRFALAKYHDTHSVPVIRAWVQRAYLAELNARIEELNRPNA